MANQMLGQHYSGTGSDPKAVQRTCPSCLKQLSGASYELHVALCANGISFNHQRAPENRYISSTMSTMAKNNNPLLDVVNLNSPLTGGNHLPSRNTIVDLTNDGVEVSYQQPSPLGNKRKEPEISKERGPLPLPKPLTAIPSPPVHPTVLKSKGTHQMADPVPENPILKPQPKYCGPSPDLLPVPEFCPTEEEFSDPMKYLNSIREIGKKYGLIKIIPPSDKFLQGQTFSKIVDPKNFIFETKLQNIHQLWHRAGPTEKFMEDLNKHLEKKGISLKHSPVVDGQPLDLYKLFYAVTSRGGLDAVCKHKRWKEVAKELKVSPDLHNYSGALKKNYVKYLLGYEQMLMKKPQENSKENATASSSDDEEIPYQEGKMFTLTSFKNFAGNFKKRWFPDETKTTPKEIENAYWNIVENADEAVSVHYGSDLDVGTHGSGFPTDPTFLSTASGWNLNIFPKWPGSLLEHIQEDIKGVIQPMLYMGMLFSSFCWHTEDNYLYSINYLHQGAPKTWYGVPAYEAEKFESVMKSTVPDLFMQHKDLLYQMVTMVSPRILSENNVTVYHTLQKPGEFMITFPKSYHAGFSHGFNCAESCNFALDDWISYGRESIEKYRNTARNSVFSLEKLLINAALCEYPGKLSEKIKSEIFHTIETEQFWREKIISRGIWRMLPFESYYLPTSTPPTRNFHENSTASLHLTLASSLADKECSVCHYDCYLSGVVCPCQTNKMVCLQHAHLVCEGCENSKKVLVFRFSQGDLEEIIQRIGMEKSAEKDKAMEISWKSRVQEGGWQLPYLNQHLYNHYGSYSAAHVGPTEETQKFQRQVEEFHSIRRGEGRRQWGNFSKLKKRGQVTGVVRGRVWLEPKIAAVNNKKQIRKLGRRAGVIRVEGIHYLDKRDEIKEGLFIMEKILQKRKIAGTSKNSRKIPDEISQYEFLIKWAGHPTSESTWEKGSDLACPGLLTQFHKKEDENKWGPTRLRPDKGRRSRRISNSL